MNKKTHFKYTVSYRKILEVNIYHDYFASGFLKFYDILVSSETNEVFKNLCREFYVGNEILQLLLLFKNIL